MTTVPTTGQPTVGLAADTPLQTFFAWERWGNFINARPGDDVEIPYDAARLQVKVYSHAVGEIRILRFPKTRTHDHVNKTDTILYEWTAKRVQFVNDDAAVCGPGHVSLHPKGVFHHGETLLPGLAVEFALEVGEPVANPTPTFVPAEDAPLVDAVTWRDSGGVRDVEAGEDAGAPPGATRYARRTVPLGAYVVREVHLSAGSRLQAERAGATMLVVLSGEVEIPGGCVLGPEDNAAFEAGVPVDYSALGDAVLVEAILP